LTTPFLLSQQPLFAREAAVSRPANLTPIH
jgi:hypothetical protein